MSERDRDRPQREEPKSKADQTLTGVAPPLIDAAVDARPHSPMYVRAGTSVADVGPVSLPRFPAPSPPRAARVSDAPPATKPAGESFAEARRYVRARPILWMAALPVLFSLSLIALTGHRAKHGREPTMSSRSAASEAAAPSASSAAQPAKAATLIQLESRPASSLSSRELVLLAEGHDQQKRAAASALREQLARDPASGKDGALQAQLLHLSEDPATAPTALSAMALLEPRTGTDLLYAVWTATTVRTDTTELARAILYSTDVRPKASPALSVALDLRVAETCEQYQAILPKALTDGDRRSLHLLTKLNTKRGCGVKKSDDCFACLRAKKDELSATISAVKSRRAPIP